MNVMTALSTRNDDPEHASRPFDKDRDGFLMERGVGTLVLESLLILLNSVGRRLYVNFRVTEQRMMHFIFLLLPRTERAPPSRCSWPFKTQDWLQLISETLTLMAPQRH